MNVKIFVVLLFMFFACEVKKDTQSKIENDSVQHTSKSRDSLTAEKSYADYRFDFTAVEPFFKFSKITDLSKQEFDADQFKKLTKTEYFEAFQDSAYADFENYTYYYYSNQGEWKGYKRYVFVKIDETCCTYFYYNIFDKDGKLTNSFILSSNRGEGEITLEEIGLILNDSLIVQSRVECVYDIDKNQKEYWNCDSSSIEIQLLGNGRTLMKKKYYKRRE